MATAEGMYSLRRIPAGARSPGLFHLLKQNIMQQFIEAIEREQAKRATTYPKMIKKHQKQGMPPDEIAEMQRQMNMQNSRLNEVLVVIKNDIQIDTATAIQCMVELMREYKMRKNYYPRLIYFKRLDQTTADYEISTWKDLCEWFAKEYVGMYELFLKSGKTRKKANK